jgi:glucuronokinase
MNIARSKQATCCARAALAGNPSDMHGGAVLAIPVRALTATVSLRDDGEHLLLLDAALKRVGVASAATWTTGIPRGVGLAGSSALVIAALRASGRAPEDPLALAQLALSVERDDLHIPAGLQDRATQAFDAPVLVDGDTARPLRAGAPFRFVVAWDPDAAADSGRYHAARVPDPAGMRELARIGRLAASAFEAGDAAVLEGAMGASAAVRYDVAPLSEPHRALAARVRALGLTPNSAGSGGAVVALVRDEAVLAGLEAPFVLQHAP